jgi:hypothetical protein
MLFYNINHEHTFTHPWSILKTGGFLFLSSRKRRVSYKPQFNSIAILWFRAVMSNNFFKSRKTICDNEFFFFNFTLSFQATNIISTNGLKNVNLICRIWGFHSGGYDEYNLLGYRTQRTKRRHILDDYTLLNLIYYELKFCSEGNDVSEKLSPSFLASRFLISGLSEKWQLGGSFSIFLVQFNF